MPPRYPLTISLGYAGPTDCCLVLSQSDISRKEFLIESGGWLILDQFHRGYDLPLTINNQHPLYNSLHYLLFEEDTKDQERH